MSIKVRGIIPSVNFLYHGDEIEVSVTGTTETQVKDLAIIKGSAQGGLDVKTLKIIARLKTSDAAAAATLKVYHDGLGTADLTLTSSSTAYELKTGNIDISGWTDGRHTIEVKLVSAAVDKIAYNELLEIYGAQ